MRDDHEKDEREKDIGEEVELSRQSAEASSGSSDEFLVKGDSVEGTSLTGSPVRELSREEARELFDSQAQNWLGISGEEFLRRWDAGDYGEPDDCEKNPPEVMRLVMLAPLVR